MSDQRIVASMTSADDLLHLTPRLLEKVDWIEVRADLFGELEPEKLRRRFKGPLLYTLRSTGEGGRCELSPRERRLALVAAAEEYDYVDVELEADSRCGAIEAVPLDQRVLSWHGAFGQPKSLIELRGLLQRQMDYGAAYYKLVVAAQSPEEALPSLLLQAEEREGSRGVKLSSFAMGEAASWSRIVAAVRGCALVYGACAETPAAAGQFSVAQLVDDYRLLRPQDQLNGKMRLCGILGRPVSGSLSPRLHNGGYADGGINAVFVPFSTDDFERTLAMVQSEEFRRLDFTVGGVAVTTPYKDAALRNAEPATSANRVGAANTLIADGAAGVAGAADGCAESTVGRGWTAYSTDPQGVVGPLVQRGVSLSGIRAAVVGAGGAGRAAALGLEQAGADVTLVNRSVDRGEQAAQRLGVWFTPLAEFSAEPFGDEFGVVVNATSLGHRLEDPLPFPIERLSKDGIVVDMVYGSATDGATKLIEAARARGLAVVDGREVLLHQAVEQFRLMNGHDLDIGRAEARLRRPAIDRGDSASRSEGQR